MTFLSRVLGFVRDVLIARIFGAEAGTDAFFVAFKIPNFLRRIFAEGAFSQAFIPVLIEKKGTGSPAEVRQFISHMSGVLGSVLFLITTISVIAAPLLVYLFAPGFHDEPDKFALTGEMLRITFPYILFISLTAFAGSVLNSYDQFAAPALTPIFLNLSLIGMAVFAAPYFAEPIVALAWGVFIAGIAQLLFQLPFLHAKKVLCLPRPSFRDPQVKQVMILMLPALFAVSVTQINLLLDTILASFLETGSVSWLYYSDRMVEFPMGVFGVALATVILPRLSSLNTQVDPRGFSLTLEWSLRCVFLIGVPSTIGLFLLAEPILCTLFQYDQFTALDAQRSGASLKAYSIGLLGFIFIKVLASGYFARKDTKTPVKFGVIAMTANMGLNLLLIIPLAHVGLALATSLSSLLNATLLFRGLKQRQVLTLSKDWTSFLIRLGLANLAMATLLYFGINKLDYWSSLSGLMRSTQLLAWITAGAAIYLTSLYLLGFRLSEFTKPSQA